MDDKCQNNPRQRKKEGEYEGTEGTTIIYANNVPLLLMISGKIRQQKHKKQNKKNKKQVCVRTRVLHVTQLILPHAN